MCGLEASNRRSGAVLHVEATVGTPAFVDKLFAGERHVAEPVEMELVERYLRLDTPRQVRQTSSDRG